MSSERTFWFVYMHKNSIPETTFIWHKKLQLIFFTLFFCTVCFYTIRKTSTIVAFYLKVLTWGASKFRISIFRYWNYAWWASIVEASFECADCNSWKLNISVKTKREHCWRTRSHQCQSKNMSYNLPSTTAPIYIVGIEKNASFLIRWFVLQYYLLDKFFLCRTNRFHLQHSDSDCSPWICWKMYQSC